MFSSLGTLQAFSDALSLQQETLDRFYALAAAIAPEQCAVEPPEGKLFAFERNVFSTLFLVITGLLVGRSRLLPLYAMVNQCMRAWVTACDNLLDDEYKEIFPFRLAGRGQRMRSVLTILLADRILWEYIDRHYRDDGVLEAAGRLSLEALAPSAAQECEEETRPVEILPSRRLLDEVHHRKTGLLFMSPLALPCRIEHPDDRRARAAERAVHDFGMACQCLDDIVDMPSDAAAGRHNLLVSLMAEGERGARVRLRNLPRQLWTAWEHLPAVTRRARQIAEGYFASSFEAMAELGLVLAPAQRGAVVGTIYRLLRVPPAGADAAENVA
ncbi:MAG: class 1 isoprenoid biosynthesis enzyme [Planctomycetaceae bacterium]|nr:class 1 isoprenoid biosynthesis enzyme [Planctomycetaceae bacterium]